jgi:hypothetical protein
MTKYQLMEAEDNYVENYVQTCIPLLLDPAWADASKLCREICFDDGFGKTIASAKIHSGRKTIRIVRGNIAEAANVLRSELAFLDTFDSFMVEQKKKAILPIDTRVAEFEVERRAKEERKKAEAEAASNPTKKAKTEVAPAV